jgi:hypothetical protein
MDTFGTVASTHPLFAEAVRRAVVVARFSPAVLAGTRVRQLVHLPITFAMPASGRPGLDQHPGPESGDGTAHSSRPHPVLRR